MLSAAEYIWLDGTEPTQMLRSKTRVVESIQSLRADELPEWSFDGSSTNQADGSNSDLQLRPVEVVYDPIRKDKSLLVLCEVLKEDGTPHASNHRSHLSDLLKRVEADLEPLVGFEQEYTLYRGKDPLAWSFGSIPQAQGPFYCGNGSDRVFGRELSEAHTVACMEAGLQIFGSNAEVMPGQWEFQIGYRGFADDNDSVLVAADHLILARWLLIRLAEKEGLTASFDNKPVKGDWNGAGCHTNISTAATRNPENGLEEIKRCIEELSKQHSAHIPFYGYDLKERLTGEHETCSIDQFVSGVGDRGASIRIPRHVEQKGHGYFEDRRPGANMDPYVVLYKLLETISISEESCVP